MNKTELDSTTDKQEIKRICDNSLAQIELTLPELAQAIAQYLNNSTGDEKSVARLTEAVQGSARQLFSEDKLEPGQTCKSRWFTGKTLVTGWKILPLLNDIDNSLRDAWAGPSLKETFCTELIRSAKSLWEKTQVGQLLSGIHPYAYRPQPELNSEDPVEKTMRPVVPTVGVQAGRETSTAILVGDGGAIAFVDDDDGSQPYLPNLHGAN